MTTATSNKGVFRSLADDLDKKQPMRRRERRVCCDSGMPIDLRYNPTFYATSGGRGGRASGMSVSGDPLAGVFGNAGYNVEAFEADDESSGQPYGTAELQDDASEEDDQGRGAAGLVRTSSRSFSAGDGADVPVWGTGELEAVEETATPGGDMAASMSDDGDPSAAVWGTGELERMEDAVADVPPAPIAATAPAEPPAPQPTGADLAAQTFSQIARRTDDPETMAFANDLQAILGGQKAHPSNEPPLAASGVADDEQPPPAADTRPNATGFTHGDFDRWTQANQRLSSAQTFDMGSFDLARQFDVFDRQMDAAEQRAARARPAPEQPMSISPRQEFVEDMSLSRQPLPVIVQTRPLAKATDLRFSLKLDVPLVPQQTGMSCWAAGASMVVGWRDQMSVDPSEIARSAGAWAQYANGLAAEDTSIFPVWGLDPEPAQSYTVEGFYGLLDRYGPLWVAAAVPGPHIRVVTGIEGDGTPDGTTLYINDPWEPGMQSFRMPNAGGRYTETYAEFVKKQETLARQEMSVPGVYVAHARVVRR